MSLSEILQTASDVFTTMLNGYIKLSNAHPLLGIASLLFLGAIGISIVKKLMR